MNKKPKSSLSQSQTKMIIVKTPSNEYYVMRGKNLPKSNSAFIFKPKARGDKKAFFINFSHRIGIPKELKNKKIMLKVEISD